MLDLASTLNSTLVDRFTTHSARIRELAAFFSESQFWQKAFPFGNSFGHLVLHLTGNLNYYIGTQIANTGYVATGHASLRMRSRHQRRRR